jgi:phosphoglycerate dehydrogenase-like enzyme
MNGYRVLLIGGYGFFGRLVQRRARHPGLHVLVAGRSAAEAGELPFVGARPCNGLLALADLEREAQGLNIVMAEAAA